MTVSPEALSAANETKEALKKFYFRMVMDYGPCGGDGAPHGGCPPGSELLKKYQAAFLHNGGKEVFSASELQREAEDHAGYGQWVFMFYNLERAVNVHLYWLDQFTRGKATLAFEDKSLGLDTVRSNEVELRRQLDHYIDLDARGRVMDVKGVNQAERDHNTGIATQLVDSVMARNSTMFFAFSPAAQPPRGRIFLFVQATNKRILVKKLYQGVPLMVDVVFEEPVKVEEYPLALEVGGKTLNLLAKPIDNQKKVFRTELFRVDPK